MKCKKNHGVGRDQRMRVFKQWGTLCWYCGEDANECDHVIPINPRGYRNLPATMRGSRGTGNTVPCCTTCNRHKDNLFLRDWRKELAKITGKQEFVFWIEETDLYAEKRSALGFRPPNIKPEVQPLVLHVGVPTTGAPPRSPVESYGFLGAVAVRCHSLLRKFWGNLSPTLGLGLKPGNDHGAESHHPCPQ